MSSVTEPRPETWKSEYPFAPNWLDLGAYRLHYVDEGTGKPLLMVHGNPTWSFLWRHLIRNQPPGYRAVAVDHVGCGLSDNPQDLPHSLSLHESNLVRLIDELDLHDITLLAHDWGGPIGLRTLLARRTRFSRIILFNTGGFPPPYIPWRIRVCRTPILGKIALQGFNLFARAAQTMAVHQQDGISTIARQGLIAPYDNWKNRHAIYEFVRDIPATPQHPTWNRLAELESALPSFADMPIQLIWGMRDWCFQPTCLDRFAQHWPHAEITRLNDIGHWVTEEAKEQVGELVTEFLQRTAS